MGKALGRTVLEQPWNEPHGTGEVCAIDNGPLFHASCYQNPAPAATRTRP